MLSTSTWRGARCQTTWRTSRTSYGLGGAGLDGSTHWRVKLAVHQLADLNSEIFWLDRVHPSTRAFKAAIPRSERLSISQS